MLAAVVILDRNQTIDGLADSKKLSPKRRSQLAAQIKAKALAWSLGRCEASEIDASNILAATLQAMARAYATIAIKPNWLQVDGNAYPPIDCAGETIIRGDSNTPAISAASILAKTTRDAEMNTLHSLYPEYGFDLHKGYPTPAHLAALHRFGASDIHRKSFAPVAKVLASQQPI